jgi:hypothetical protein
MTSLEVLGVNGGDGWDWECDRTERDPREDWRLCSNRPARDRLGDFCMFNGATNALECLSISSCSNAQSAMMASKRRAGSVGGRYRSLKTVVR